MKKRLIALAAASIAGSAFAQSSVTLFGVLDLGYENVKTNAGRISGLAPSANSSSRLGFRGTEDLGGGLTAGFWLESAINPASGIGSSGTSGNNQFVPAAGATSLGGGSTAGGLTFNRRSTVSVYAPWGEVRLGRDYTPSFWNYNIFDPYGTNSVGNNLVELAGVALANTDVRASNSVGYFLPSNLGGIYGQAMYAFGNRSSAETAMGYGVARSTRDNGTYAGARIGYAAGPLNAAVSYARTKYAAGTNTVSTLMGLPAFAIGDFTDMSMGGSYQIGPVKAMANLSRNKVSNAVTLGNTGAVKGLILGVDWGVGSGDVLISYSRIRASNIVATDPTANKWALGYFHHLSKRTDIYAIFARVTNSNGSAQTAASGSSGALGAVGGAVNVNGTSTGMDMGLRHAF